MRLDLDLYCRVIDNYGDAGVCWRLARRMVLGFGWRVRLYCDQPALIERMAPDGLPDVEVLTWEAAGQGVVGDLVIEAFGCDLPGDVIEHIAARKPAPVWLNLEYLSAQDWARAQHGMVSIVPSGPAAGMKKYFFFPGFTVDSGGLLAEPHPGALDGPSVLAQFGIEPVPAALKVFLFCYPDAPLAALIYAAVEYGKPLHFLLPDGQVSVEFARMLAARDCPRLHWSPLPFMRQAQFDAVLATCDLALVRGEDSLARAVLAGVPLLWHIYPQDETAHLPKLHAFLDWYCQEWPAELALEWRQANLAWNTRLNLPALAQCFAEQAAAAPLCRDQSAGLAALPDLGQRLSYFVSKRLNS